MTPYSKVSWKDGMFLLPQHFQQSERGLEAALSLRFAEHVRQRFGVVDLKIDLEALAERQVRIALCRAVFPDGLTVNIPDGDPEPERAPFELPATGVLGVYLTVPAWRRGVPLVAAEQGPDKKDGRSAQRASVRYLEQVVSVPDDQDPENRQEIEVAVKNLRLLVAGPEGLSERLEGLQSIKIAQVRRGAGGAPVLHEDYIPPCPYLAAVPVLQRRAREILGEVATRATEMTTKLRQRGGEVQELIPAEVPDFWYLSQLNLQLPVLRQLIEQPGTHPASLYAELLRLAGGLCTFFLQAPLELPPYRHDAIGECFDALDRRIGELLLWKRNETWRSFAMQQEGRVWSGNISDPAYLTEGEFFLLAAGLPPDELEKLPRTIIIGERGKIEDFVAAAFQGVRIIAEPRPPSPIPVRHDARYFRVTMDSPHWAEIRRTGRAAAYLPRSFAAIHMELIGVISGGR